MLSDQVVSNLTKFKPADLARLLWGFAAAHYDDGAVTKAVSKALAEKAGELAPKEAVQVRGVCGKEWARGDGEVLGRRTYGSG